MAAVIIDLKNKPESMQLCWFCRKANASEDCPWANRLIPVKGWTAEKTVLNGSTVKGSYHIKDCPLFVEG